jgi:hypothetical protein
MVFMLNFDMVGRLRDHRLFVASGRLDTGLRTTIDSAARISGLRAAFVSSDGVSDDAFFADAGVRAIDVSTGMHADYHTARDVADRLDIEGLHRVIDVAERIVRRIADR